MRWVDRPLGVLEVLGYIVVKFTSHNLSSLSQDQQPIVTVFCAVWHQQKNKLDLLRSHWENLKSQTLNVHPCYIFDNGDTAPDWLDAPWHSFDEPLSIYEAWSAGTALSTTPYVMNLNMDDRLARDAVGLLAGTALETNSALVCGEWEICFDEKDMAEPFDLTDIDYTHFKPTWPPVLDENLRLGSGTGERGTFGPATLWNVHTIGKWYPSYFKNGEVIRSMGDGFFWSVLKGNNLKLTRVPKVIGKYLSDPDSQGEFRPHQDAELLKAHGLSERSMSSRILSGEVSCANEVDMTLFTKAPSSPTSVLAQMQGTAA